MRKGWVKAAASAWRALLGLPAALLVAACATPQMEAQWRDRQAPAGSMRGKPVLVVCRGLDLTLERLCEDRLAADAQAIGIRVVRAELPAGAAEPVTSRALLDAARAAGAEAVLAMQLERFQAAVAPSGGSVGVGIGGSRGGWSGGTSGAIGITLPLGGAGPALASGTSLFDAGSGKMLWSGRARGSGSTGEAAQIGELTRVTSDALRASGLF